MLYEGLGMIVGSARDAAAGCFRFRKSNCAAAAAGSTVRRWSAAAAGCRLRMQGSIKGFASRALSYNLLHQLWCCWLHSFGFNLESAIASASSACSERWSHGTHQRCGWRQLRRSLPPTTQLRRPVAELRPPEAGPQLQAAASTSSLNCACA